ncbi:hypothetical protein [Actinoplanes aureus]|uniref:Uncharacterized protein n=1 Tax=Actinoplanes aureus TaxID=2792083 RepID=A0A931CQG4_9ACTN|nr:hypothetical protein [Actinoplanes aureus]MBG0569245.1 hypothetical protein [Actinoplanes aureus]
MIATFVIASACHTQMCHMESACGNASMQTTVAIAMTLEGWGVTVSCPSGGRLVVIGFASM